MDITLDKKSTTDGLIKIKLSQSDYQPKVEEKIKDYARKANIKGFRQGKVPHGVIKKMFGKSILVEEVNHLLSHSVSDYIKSNKLKILGEPLPNQEKANQIDWDTQNEFEFEFQIGLVDDFNYELSSKVKLKSYPIEVDKKVIDDTVADLQKRFGEVAHPEVSEEGDNLHGQVLVEGSETPVSAHLELPKLNKKVVKTSKKKDRNSVRSCITVDREKVFFYSEDIKEAVKVVHIADTHLFRDDARGMPYQEYSSRMAKAYNQTTHFKTGEITNPEEGFEQSLALAIEENADLITLVGDIFSFPSEAAIEWVLPRLEATGIPYIYTAGNHDWHYEGMEGTLKSLRDTWIGKRLLPMYQGNNPLMAAYDIKGIRFLAIDNSTYEINEDQLAFFAEQVDSGLPLVLLVHIPMYAPGKGIYFGCGNPNWGAATDRNFSIERRPRWPESGHSQTTIDFHKQVFSASNLLGIFSGHIHQNSVEIVKGKPQIVSDDNASGAYLDISFLPMDEQDKELIL